MNISQTFPKEVDPETGRTLIRLTDHNAFCYPLYYFIPSVTDDGRFSVYHVCDGVEVQLWVLELATGIRQQLTHAQNEPRDAQWIPWCTPCGKGVLDHRSVLNTKTNEVIYFDNNIAKEIDIETLQERELFVLPADRYPISQSCVTPDGKWFVFSHIDGNYYNNLPHQNWAEYLQYRYRIQDCIVQAFSLETGEMRDILILNALIHHIIPYDNEHFLLNHPPTESGILFTGLEGNWYTHIRTKSRDGRMANHCAATKRGIVYEACKFHGDNVGGIYDPFTHNCIEYKLPAFFGYTHTGCDPHGGLIFYESLNYDDTGITGHCMYYMSRYDKTAPEWQLLMGNRKTYGSRSSQKSHFHPRVTPDGRYILFTGGCEQTLTNQLYLLDISDIPATKGLPDLSIK